MFGLRLNAYNSTPLLLAELSEPGASKLCKRSSPRVLNRMQLSDEKYVCHAISNNHAMLDHATGVAHIACSH